jgi:hypothetical protein
MKPTTLLLLMSLLAGKFGYCIYVLSIATAMAQGSREWQMFFSGFFLITGDAKYAVTIQTDSKNIVTYRPIPRQRLVKYIPAELYAHKNRMSIARQWISKQAFSTIERLCFLRGPC